MYRNFFILNLLGEICQNGNKKESIFSSVADPKQYYGFRIRKNHHLVSDPDNSKNHNDIQIQGPKKSQSGTGSRSPKIIILNAFLLLKSENANFLTNQYRKEQINYRNQINKDFVISQTIL